MSSQSAVFDHENPATYDNLRMTGPIYEVLAPHHVAVEGDPYTMVCLVGGFIARSAVSRDNRVWNDLPLDPEAILRRVRSEELPALEQQTGEPRLTTSGLVVRFSRSLPKLLDY